MRKQLTHKHKPAFILLALLLVFSILLPTFATTSALNTQYEVDTITTSKICEVINTYSNTNSITYSIINAFPLQSISGGTSYTLYQLSPYGYAILLNETQSLMEACYVRNSVLPVDINSDYTIYYGGPGIYCVKQGNEFYNLANDSVLASAELSEIVQMEDYVQNAQKEYYSLNVQTNTTRGNQRSTFTYSAGYDYFSSLNDFGINENGTCTVIAAQMLLSYYDNYVDDDFIAAQYEEGAGSSEAFHQLLCDYAYGSNAQGGIYIHEAASGITNYLHDRHFHYSLESEYSSRDNAISQIIITLGSGKPVIASMGTHLNAPWNHSVLVYSVNFDSTNPIGSAVLTMNLGTKDGSANQRAYVASASWFYECGYLANNTGTHEMGEWIDLNSIYHIRICDDCSFTEKGLHYESWSIPKQRCTVCPRTGSCANIMKDNPDSSESHIQ